MNTTRTLKTAALALFASGCASVPPGYISASQSAPTPGCDIECLEALETRHEARMAATRDQIQYAQPEPQRTYAARPSPGGFDNPMLRMGLGILASPQGGGGNPMVGTASGISHGLYGTPISRPYYPPLEPPAPPVNITFSHSTFDPMTGRWVPNYSVR